MPAFNPDAEVGVSLAACWKTWLTDFDMFLAASSITDNTRKCALLLYQAGARVREIFAQLHDTGNADAFDTAKQKLTAYFEPQKNRRYDVYIFRKAFQGPNETLDQYHTRLKTLADPCEFADLDFELEERIIIGGSSSCLRKQALRDPKYDLKAMLLDGRRDEMSKFQSKEIEGKPGSREETNQVTVAPRKCRNCGGSHSHNSPCPAQGLECHYCGKSNHFAKVYRGKSKAGRMRTKPHHRKPARAQSHKNLKPLTHSDSESDYEEYLYPVQSKHQARPHAKITVSGHSFNIMVDTGASLNVIDRSTFSNMSDITLDHTKTKAFAYKSSQPVHFIGKFQALVQTKKRYTVATFFVVDDENSGSLMNAQTAQELGLISLHLNMVSAKTPLRDKPILPETNDKALSKILVQNTDVFDGLGKLKEKKIILNIDETVQPTVEPQRCVPYHIREKVKVAIKELEKDGIIEKVPPTQATPWISAIVAVPKKDGSVRICVDMRKANQAIKRVRYLIHTVDEISQELNGAKFSPNLILHKLTISWN